MKNVIELPFASQLEHNLSLDTSRLQVILGPRQVGKTTTTLWFLEKNYPGKFLYVSADKVFNANHDWLLENWQKAHFEKLILVIDEIQKIENWAEYIKSLWDENQQSHSPIKCILLGSSSLDIQKGLGESLAGRFQLIRAYHWNYQETRKLISMDFEDYLKYGGYPGSYSLLGDPDQWADYMKNSILIPVIEKDILLNRNVKSPSLFKQAFELLCAYPAQEVSYTKILGQLQKKGNVELVKYYISLFEGAFLFKTIEKFSTNKIMTKSSSPKILPLCPSFYFLGIMDDYESQERGRVFEQLVGIQLNRTKHELYYWREGNDEVDFVLKKGRKIWAIEVKSGRKRSAAGLEAFKKKFSQAKLVIINPENYQEFEKDVMSFLESV